jgi:predicted NUDIX family phosphoesterase
VSNNQVQQAIKHPQFILGMFDAYYDNIPAFKDGITTYPAAQWFEEAQAHLVIARRHELESNRAVRQLLPYLIVRQENDEGGWNYLPYMRNATIGEGRLVGKVSVGYGGHIDAGDVQYLGSVINLRSTIWLAALREFFEELEVLDENGKTPVGWKPKFDDLAEQFIVDDSNDVNPYHVAIMAVLTLPKGWTAKCKEAELTSLPPMSAQEILSSGNEVESWSKMYLEANLPKSQVWGRGQLPSQLRIDEAGFTQAV